MHESATVQKQNNTPDFPPWAIQTRSPLSLASGNTDLAPPPDPQRREPDGKTRTPRHTADLPQNIYRGLWSRDGRDFIKNDCAWRNTTSAALLGQPEQEDPQC